jgi:hypothetical protein
MNEIPIIECETFECPLIGEEIELGECYDVQMVRDKFINPKFLDFEFDKAEADYFCTDCIFNQLQNQCIMHNS